ncbi:MAG: GNAT family N-acetyltransferase [Microlunatus sp.]
MIEPELPPGIRPATVADVSAIHELICDLATYERARDEVKATPDQLRAALFGPAPGVHALVAEAAGEVVGFALYFLSYSTWEGVHGIYLEDLYVRPEHRGSGLGKALLSSLAAIAAARGHARLEWSVLDWNTPSIAFYRSLGAVSMDDWTRFRLSGETLTALASQVATRRNG